MDKSFHKNLGCQMLPAGQSEAPDDAVHNSNTCEGRASGSKGKGKRPPNHKRPKKLKLNLYIRPQDFLRFFLACRGGGCLSSSSSWSSSFGERLLGLPLAFAFDFALGGTLMVGSFAFGFNRVLSKHKIATMHDPEY